MTSAILVRVLLLLVCGQHAKGVIYRGEDHYTYEPTGEAQDIDRPSLHVHSGPSSTFFGDSLSGYDPSYAQSGSIVSSGLILFTNSDNANTDSSVNQESGNNQVGHVSSYNTAQLNPRARFQLKPDAKPVFQSKAGMWDIGSSKKPTGSEIATGASLGSVVKPNYKPQHPSVSSYNPAQVNPQPQFMLKPNIKSVFQSKAGMWDIGSSKKPTGSENAPRVSGVGVGTPSYKPQQPSVSRYSSAQVSPKPEFQLKPDVKPVFQSKAGMWDIGSSKKPTGSENPPRASGVGVGAPSYKPQQPSVSRYSSAQVSPQPEFQLKPDVKPVFQSKAGMWDIGSSKKPTGSENPPRASGVGVGTPSYKPQQPSVSRYSSAQVSPQPEFQLKPDVKPVFQSKAGMWDIGSKKHSGSEIVTGSSSSVVEPSNKPQQPSISRYSPAQVSPQPEFQLKPNVKPVFQSKAGMWDIGSKATGYEKSPRASLRSVVPPSYKPQQPSISRYNPAQVRPQPPFHLKPDAKPVSQSKAGMWDIGSSRMATASEIPSRTSLADVDESSYKPQHPNYKSQRPNYKSQRPNYKPQRPNYQYQHQSYKPQRSIISGYMSPPVFPQQGFQLKPNTKPVSQGSAGMWDTGSTWMGTGSESSPRTSWDGVEAGSYNPQPPTDFAAERFGH